MSKINDLSHFFKPNAEICHKNFFSRYLVDFFIKTQHILHVEIVEYFIHKLWKTCGFLNFFAFMLGIFLWKTFFGIISADTIYIKSKARVFYFSDVSFPYFRQDLI